MMIVGGGGSFRRDLSRVERKKTRQRVKMAGWGLVLFGMKWGRYGVPM